ncbi:MAG: hypothetical protein JNL87_09250 [Burkholderiaceae bacterium]|nr:hypothetical protein [Burkholderiaceae bacterium]
MVALTDTAARMTVPVAPRRRGRPAAKRTRGLRERAWWVMRELPRFTLDDLLLTLVDDGQKDAPSNLQKYISALERVGVLVRLQRRVPGSAPTSNGHVIWRLARDLGRAAPVWRSTQRVVFDPNSGALLPVLQATEEGQP